MRSTYINRFISMRIWRTGPSPFRWWRVGRSESGRGFTVTARFGWVHIHVSTGRFDREKICQLLASPSTVRVWECTRFVSRKLASSPHNFNFYLSFLHPPSHIFFVEVWAWQYRKLITRPSSKFYLYHTKKNLFITVLSRCKRISSQNNLNDLKLSILQTQKIINKE